MSDLITSFLSVSLSVTSEVSLLHKDVKIVLLRRVLVEAIMMWTNSTIKNIVCNIYTCYFNRLLFEQERNDLF